MDPERREKLGQRWVCHACEARFYDLRRPEPRCPRCGADPREAPEPEKPRRVRARKARKPKAAASGTAVAGPAASAARETEPEEAAPSPASRGRRSPAGKKATVKTKSTSARTKAARAKGHRRAKKVTRRADGSSAAGDPDQLEEGISNDALDLEDSGLGGDSHIEEELDDA